MNPVKLGSLALSAALVLATAPAAASAHVDRSRGSVVSGVPVLGLEDWQVKEFLQPLGVWVPEARRGVDAYRVVYRTVDVAGHPTTASTLIAFPRDAGRRLKPALWLHGTQSYRGDAPSVSECCDRAAAVLFASIGYAATAPDYLGLGEGPGTHPYLHSAATVSASLDALRATRDFAAGMGHSVGGPTVVAGFSQGANATLLVARALQRGAANGFTLAAIAPISGAYALFDVEWPAALDGLVAPRAATYYLAYITVAWNRIYHLYPDESAVFRAPYAGHVADLFDGGHTMDETTAALPGTPAELLRPEYADLLRHPRGALARAAYANDDACLRWRPAVPVRLYAAHGDPEAVYANSERCLRTFAGADVTLTDVGDVDHITSVILAVPQVAHWFATLI